MKRLLTVLLLAAGLELCADRGEAQIQILIGNPGDSVVVALAGATTRFWVTAANLPSYLTYAQLTFLYDPTRIDSIAVEASDTGFRAVASSMPGPGTFTVTASGGAGSNLFRLRVKLAADAHDGGYLWARVDSLASPYPDIAAYGGGVQAVPAQVCHATNVWGDVDGNGQVNSRDALITLSAAVGLQVTGFNLALGDVDGDGLATSRDALLMLSSSISLPIYVSNRIGLAIPDGCPGLTAPGETMVFKRSLTSGGGIFRLDAASTTAAQVTADTSNAWPRLNAGDTTVAFECKPNICLVDRDGSNLRTLTDTLLMASPDWSPDGANLAFIEVVTGFVPTLYTMNVSGGNRTSIHYGSELPRRVAWSHDGTRVAYPDSSQSALRTITMDSAHTAKYLTTTGADLARWSPGDSLVAYATVGLGPILGVPADGGTPRALVTFPHTRAFDWGPAGLIFSMPDSHGVQSLWLLQGGPSGPLVRLTNPGSGQADDQPSLRRNP